MLSKIITEIVSNQYWSKIPMNELRSQAGKIRLNKNNQYHFFAEDEGRLVYRSSDRLLDLTDIEGEDFVIIGTREIETMLHEALF